ncbi:acyl-CoA reductase [Alteromonadaceae bacterium BrNp21-10]|nr:acyl-CoA reductase [Alteromonadaceae bacterium BrNp21-10]
MILSPKQLLALENVQWRIPLQGCAFTDNIAPWSNHLVSEINKLAQYLLTNSKVKATPELVALAFWARKSNIKSIQKTMQNDHLEQPRSVVHKVFHIAPANVDTVFFYSLILSVLAGNQNIVRVSLRSGDITQQLIKLLDTYLKTHQSCLSQLISIVEYDAEHRSATEAFSQWCDLRVLWGGDKAIQAISHIRPQTRQIAFPDRFSIAIIQLTEVEQIASAVDGLIRDLLPFRQQACSSPKAFYWWQTPNALQKVFWQRFGEQLGTNSQQFSMSDQVEQIICGQRLIMQGKVIAKPCQAIAGMRVIQVEKLSAVQFELHSGYGLLCDVQLDTLDTLPFADKLQTVSQFGLSQAMLQKLTKYQDNKGFKRLTTLGQALTFESNWDGINLPRAFTFIKSCDE